METKIRILLADDHKVLRDGLRALLDGEGDMEVIAEAGTVDDAVQSTAKFLPDVVVMDLGMPGGSGLDAIRQIRQKELHVRIVVLSMHSGREMVMQVLQAGSDGYVPKSSAHTDLIQAIRIVYKGQRFLHPDATTALVDELLDKQVESKLVNILSDRERDVLKLTAMGFTSREIGEQLALSPKTVDTYRERAMMKLNIEHRTDIIRFALRAGLLDSLNSPEK
ncbi:MAG: response regulator transcription factor [Anaerolineales bacterium]|nr:response regulator transcription factor [Anaerolineales bacterium]